LGSAFLQNQAAGKALGAQTDATNSANALQKYQYDTTRADYAPYRQAGTQAVGQMSNLLANPNSITQDPGYQFGLDQGVQGVDRSAASKGSLYSGATLKALQRYGTDYGTTKLNDTFNRLGSVAQHCGHGAGWQQLCKPIRRQHDRARQCRRRQRALSGQCVGQRLERRSVCLHQPATQAIRSEHACFRHLRWQCASAAEVHSRLH